MKKILIVLSILTFILVGCSSSEAGPVELTIDLAEFSYAPNNIELKVGQEVTLTITNTGALRHEIMFGRDTVMMADGIPNGYELDMFEFAGVEPGGMMLMDADDHEEEGMDMEGMDMEGDDQVEDGMDMEGDDNEEEGMDMEGEEHEDDGDDHEEEGMDMEGMEMEGEEEDHDMHAGYMTTIDINGGTTTITFTVTEDMVGVWEYGCFLDKGTHYAAGMVGTLTIVE